MDLWLRMEVFFLSEQTSYGGLDDEMVLYYTYIEWVKSCQFPLFNRWSESQLASTNFFALKYCIALYVSTSNDLAWHIRILILFSFSFLLRHILIHGGLAIPKRFFILIESALNSV